MCIINPFDRVMVGDKAVHNDLDCPLLILTQKLCLISPTKIVCPISVVHECSETCTFYQSTTFTTIEREAVNTNKVIFKHDYSNDVFLSQCVLHVKLMFFLFCALYMTL